MKRFIFIHLIMVFSTPLYATDWFVRPAGGTYGDEDGTSYANAWDGLKNVVWGESGVVAGDNLYICGMHIFEEAPAHSADRNWTINASGTNENNRITIRGDASSVDASYEDGIIWGIDTQAGENRTITEIGSGVWSITGGESYDDFYFQDVTSTSHTILDQIDTTTGTLTGTWTFTAASTTVSGSGGDASAELDDGDYVYLSTGGARYIVNGEPGGANTFELTTSYAGDTVTDEAGETIYIDTSAHLALVQAAPGSYWSGYYTYPMTLYVHCTDSLSPDGRIVGGANGWHIDIRNQSYLTFSNIKFYMNPQYTWLASGNSYVNYEECEFYYEILSFRADIHHIEVTDCEFAYGPGGISIQYYDGSNPHHITINGCYFHDIGNLDKANNSDCEGVGLNGGDDIIIEHCNFYNVGSAITTFPYGTTTQLRNIFRYNYIRAPHNIGLAIGRGRGIEINQDELQTGSKSAQVYGNIVFDAPGYAYRTIWHTDQVVFYNNLAYNCGGGFYSQWTYDSTHAPNVVFVNNIIWNESLAENFYQFHYSSLCSEGNYSFVSDYNIFYPDTDNVFSFRDATESEYYYSFSEWQALSKTGCTFDTHSLLTDPQLLSPERHKFAPAGPTSACVGAGTASITGTDFRGNDIGRVIGPINWDQYCVY